jgi:hypothetical protein
VRIASGVLARVATPALAASRRASRRPSGRSGTRRCSCCSTARDFGAFTAVGFFIGLTAGAIVLTSLCNHTGGSILAVAIWHASYNLSAATTAADGMIAAVSRTLVIFWAVGIVQRERAGIPALGLPTHRHGCDQGVQEGVV